MRYSLKSYINVNTNSKLIKNTTCSLEIHNKQKRKEPQMSALVNLLPSLCFFFLY